MLFSKITHFVIQKSLGKEVALALTLLRTLADAAKSIEQHNITDLARFVFGKLPENWRDPKGPATEAEFIDTVNAGKIFLAKIRNLTRS